MNEPTSRIIDRAVPIEILDDASGAAQFGTYRGPLTRFDLGSASLRTRLTREKRWIYCLLSKPPFMVGFAVLDLGFVQSAFAFVHEEGKGLVLDLPTQVGLPVASRVESTSTHRIDARVRSVSGSFGALERRGAQVLELAVTTKRLVVRAELDLRAGSTLTAVAPIVGGEMNATEKRALLPLSGTMAVDGRRVALDGGVGGFDITWGRLARQTMWNWAFAMGTSAEGEPLALNLVQGFVGEPECAVFYRGELHGLSEGRFEFDHSQPSAPWRVCSERRECDLRFEPSGVHAERLNLGIVASRFVQPVGTFSGTISIGEKKLRLERVPGVVEDQFVRW